MPLKVACPSCGTVYTIPETQAGKKARCKKCGTMIRIPQGEEAVPKPQLAKDDLDNARSGIPVGRPQPTHSAMSDDTRIDARFVQPGRFTDDREPKSLLSWSSPGLLGG